MKRQTFSHLSIFSLAVVLLAGQLLSAADPAKPKSEKANKTSSDSKPETKKGDDGLVALNKQKTVLLDLEGKRLLLKTKVCLQEGVLEMLCCKKQTKEHESILSIDSSAKAIHAGLLAIGAKVGSPVRFSPKFQPPQGQKLNLYLQWKDKAGKLHREPAQGWVRTATSRYFTAKLDQLPGGVVIDKKSELRYDEKYKELIWFGQMSKKERDDFLAKSKDKPFQAAIKKFYDETQPRLMKADWIFAGSGFSIDEMTGEKFYHAESGDLICVANFPTAIIDVSIASSASGEGNLLFEANQDKIPPRGTPVTIEISLAKK
ncbi:YdjY domain-containing protein [uncultured Gimesia sp.]|uniref:YdjY domain-containing protein n=1 Tax=uncultured Gimesia sp. TaxID=1678688 RepID=UPI0030DDD8EF|tara:strand:+ start:28429 stop:29379 length:951 start_codon:yes stop_codon:yes gene_type:complete